MSSRNTKQKQIIMDVLRTEDHPTAGEVCADVHEKHPEISRSTVFRDLAQFADEGSVRRVTFSDGEIRYDPNVTPHVHAKCIRCGRIYDIPADKISYTISDEGLGGFEIRSATLELSVKCPACIAAEAEEDPRS